MLSYFSYNCSSFICFLPELNLDMLMHQQLSAACMCQMQHYVLCYGRLMMSPVLRRKCKCAICFLRCPVGPTTGACPHLFSLWSAQTILFPRQTCPFAGAEVFPVISKVTNRVSPSTMFSQICDWNYLVLLCR